MRITALLALSLTALLVVAACGGGGKQAATPSGPAVATPVGGVVPVSISEGKIQPKAVSLKVGQEVTFQVTATDSYHTFSIDELDVNLRVGKGKTESVKLTVNEAGTYLFYCRVTGHRGFGEEGKLIVE